MSRSKPALGGKRVPGLQALSLPCLLWPHNRSQFTASCSHTAKEAFQDPGVGGDGPTLVQPGACSGRGRWGGGLPIHPPVPAFHSCSLRNSVREDTFPKKEALRSKPLK